MEPLIMQSNLHMNMSKYKSRDSNYQTNSFTSNDCNTSEDMFESLECIPSAQRPIAYQYNAHGFNIDGDITMTPVKNVHVGIGQTNSNGVDKRTVTFDDTVDIQLLSPYSSVCNDAYDSTLSDSNTTGTLSSRSFESATSFNEDSIETIVASDYEQPITRSLLYEVPENKLARPEFSSIISLTKERHKVENDNLDLVNAVREKLNVNKNRVKVEERAYQHLNREEQQFRRLQGTEVSDDAIYKTERYLSARVNPHIYDKSDKVRRQEPDIMEFIKPGFQKETGSYSVQSFVHEQTVPKTIESTHAFDVYQHINSWETL